jgi:hypothetical protein
VRDTITQTSDRVGPLGPATTYYWRVTPLNSVGAGNSSSRHFRTTALTPPDMPVLISPANGLGGVSVTPTLQWDSTARAASWRLQVAYDAGFVNRAVNDSTLTQPGRQVGPLLNNTTFYWRVNARNDSGTSPYSAAWSFITLAPPEAPALQFPRYNDNGISLGPTFTWAEASGAVSYELQVSRDQSMTNFVEDDSGITDLYHALAKSLQPYTLYYWRVRGKNSAGNGQFSAAIPFRTSHIGPANWRIPIAVSETGPAGDTVYFGVHPQATRGIDYGLGEFELPPPTPGFFDVRFVDVNPPELIGEGLRLDLLPFSQYAQRDTFRLRFQPGTGSYPMHLSWNSAYIRTVCDSMVITDDLGGAFVRKRMNIDSTVSVSSTSLTSLLIILYSAYPIDTPLEVRPGGNEMPEGFALYQNYPNPFNPSTRIQFSTEWSAHIRLQVYDVLGREVASLADGDFFPGLYSVYWNATGNRESPVPSGLYYIRMIATSLSGSGSGVPYTSTRKMVLMK